MGYLGKISALVTANTGDFSRNLNAAASDVRKFAASVQSNITRASNDAERSFKAIYTPLQTLERSLKAASSMKLSFKGFDGAIRDVNVLKERLTSIKGTQIDLILKASGLQTISEFRNAIKDISNESFNFAIKFGGIDKLKLIREELRGVSSTSINAVLSAGGLERLKELKETVSGLKGDQLNLALRVGGTETLTKVEQQAAGLTQKDMKLLLKVGGAENLDRIIEELSGVNSRSIDALINVKGMAGLDAVLKTFKKLPPQKIQAVFSALGARDLAEATTRMRQLVSVSEQISKPLAAATSRMAGLTAEVQAGFLPALNAAQNASESLTAQIKAGATIGEQQFARYEKRVRATVEAVERLAEASALAGAVPSGAELAFVRPGARDDLAAAGVAGRNAAELPAAAIGRGGLRGDVQMLSQAARYVVQLEASLSNAELLKIDTTQAQKNLDNARETLRRITEVVEGKISLNVKADEARQELARFKAEVRSIADTLGPPTGMEKLKTAAESANQAVQRLNAGLEKTKLAADIESLKTDIIAAGNMPAGVMREKAFATTATRATLIEQQASAADLPMVSRGDLVGSALALKGARVDRLRAIDTAWDQSVRGLVGGVDEVDQRFMSLTDRISKLDLADRIDLDPAIAEFRMAAAAGETYSRQLELVAALEARVGRSEAIGTVGRQVESLPAGAVQEDLRLRVAALRSAASSPFDLTAPTDSADSVARSTAAAQSLGLPLEAPQRQIDGMISRTTALKSQLDQLPASVRSQFIPALQAAERELVRMAGGADTTGDQIEQAAASLRNLENTARRLSAIDAFGRNFGNMNEFLSGGRVREFSGEMEALRGVVAGAKPGRARDAAARASDRLQRVRTAQLQLDEDERTSGLTFPDQRADLERRSRRAEMAADARAAQAAGGSAASVGRKRKRGGDISRGGADKASLALTQLGFAVDDFMSSTGGLEFKLRAISNNITQMAFVLGGATGLFIGLGAVLAGNVAIGFMKYLNNGRSAEDQTKAFSDSLERQKSLVEELAQAFDSLGDSISQGTRSTNGEKNADIDRQIEDIRKKQRAARESTALDLDPEVQRQRAEQNKLRKSLDAETDIGRRTAIQSQIRASREMERRRTGEVLQNRPSAADVVGAIEEARRFVEFDRGMRTNADPRQFTKDEVERRRQAAVAGIDVAAPRDDAANLAAQRRALERQIADLTQDATGFGPAATRASDRKNQLEVLLASLELPLRKAVDELAVAVIQASRGPAEQIRQAQEEVAEAIKAGLPGARLFQFELEKNAAELATATKKLAQVQSGKDEFDNPLSVDEQTRLTQEARGTIAGLEARRSKIAAQTDAFAYERTVDPQRQIEARMGRARGNLNAAGLEDGRLARRMREIDAEREKIRRDSQMPENDNAVMKGFFEGRDAALNQEVAAIEAATIAIKMFADELNRASEEVKGNLNSAQQAADEARRADLGNSTPQTQEARRRAEFDLEKQRDIEKKAQTEIAVERDRLEQMQRPDVARLQQIDEELKGGAGGANREALIREREGIKAKMAEDARAFGERTAASRDASTAEAEQAKIAAKGKELVKTPEQRFKEETDAGLEAIRQNFDRQALSEGRLNDVTGMKAAQDEFLKDREKQARTATAEGRGAELGMTEREKFRRDFAEGAGADITARAKELRDKGEDPTKFLNQAIKNQMESVAPMVTQFADERQNAMLQGPSRAALNVSDVSTTQGASELTRLLRGDDSAKDVNLAELQKQTGYLADIRADLKANNPEVLL